MARITKRILSIRQRLLLAASLVLSAFLGLTGLSLDEAFRSSSEEALQVRLFSSVYALLAAAEEGKEGELKMPDVLINPRFNRPDSGLYAQVTDSTGSYHWYSGSSLGYSIKFSRDIAPGDSEIGRFKLADSEVIGLNFGIVWEDFKGRELKYVLSVAEDLKPLEEQVDAFRDTLFLWLGGGALLLLLVQGWVLNWGLLPLRKVEQALTEIESGKSVKLQGVYPKELNRLTSNINSLIAHAQARQQRYRDSLGDLAHSLKTPLAILQSVADEPSKPSSQAVKEQVERMNQIVSHQLQRATASGRNILSQSVPVKPLVERLVKSLDKVYFEKAIQWQISIDERGVFVGDEGDLMELLGNLMENACKYGHRRVSVSAEDAQPLHICIEDDGEGIPDHQAEAVFQRGHRADTRQPGQGIGLAVAADIASAYGGSIKIGTSDTLGGTAINIWLPAG
ncbi:MAG: ATP-binding protein [Candidatus Thiodiazotropha sp.]|jgi:two-component system, OmpR family, sensor histidine kinase PhoQ